MASSDNIPARQALTLINNFSDQHKNYRAIVMTRGAGSHLECEIFATESKSGSSDYVVKSRSFGPDEFEFTIYSSSGTIKAHFPRTNKTTSLDALASHFAGVFEALPGEPLKFEQISSFVESMNVTYGDNSSMLQIVFDVPKLVDAKLVALQTKTLLLNYFFASDGKVNKIIQVINDIPIVSEVRFLTFNKEEVLKALPVEPDMKALSEKSFPELIIDEKLATTNGVPST